MSLAMPEGNLSPRAYGAMALLIGILGMGLRLWLHQPPLNSDDMNYFFQGHSFSPDPTNTHAMRLAMVGLAAFWSGLLGVNATAFYASLHSIALLSFLGIALMTRTLSSAVASLWVLMLWATSFVFLSTETLYVPDSFGTAWINLAIAVLGMHGRRTIPGGGGSLAPSGIPWLPLLGGVFFWAACAARESFVIFFPALLIVIWVGPVAGRRHAFQGLALGLLIGTVIELTLMQFLMEDPWARIKTLLLYPDMAADAASQNPPTWYEFLTRYPRMLHYTQSAELPVFVAGGLGVLLWLRRRRGKDWAKLSLWGFTFFFIAFAVVRLHPPSPLMNAHLRYYLTALPFIHLAAVEFMLWLGHTRTGRTPWGRMMLVSLPVAVMTWNLVAYAHSPAPARNGNDAYFLLPRIIQSDQARTATPRHLFTYRGTIRVMQLFLSGEQGWTLTGITKKTDLDHVFMEGGYLLMDMRRFFGFEHLRNRGERVHPLLGLVERHPILMRHHYRNQVTDLIRLSPTPTPREMIERPGALDQGWHGDPPLSRSSPPFQLARGGWLAMGERTPPPQGPPLPGDHLVELIFKVHTPHGGVAQARATLLRWPREGGAARPQPLGIFAADDTPSEVILWSYLPEASHGLGVMFQHHRGEEMEIQAPRLRLMNRLPGEPLDQAGDAW